MNGGMSFADLLYGMMMMERAMYGSPEETPENDDGTHKHECGECGTIWEHGNDCAGNEKLHTCPGCKVMLAPPWWKYFGDGEPCFKTDSIGRNRKVKKPALPMAA